LPSPDKLGYLPFQARSQLGPHDVIVLLGADDPVCVFGYAGETPRLAPAESQVIDPAGDGRDPLEALQAIAASLELPKTPSNVVQKAEHGDVKGHLQPDTLCRTLARLLPEGAIIADDGITSTLALYPNLTGAAPHDYMSCKGNSIGFALPAATGAAIAAPGRRVVAYSGDGSALYTIQALWTQAREGLDVTNIICVNRKYAILQMELMRSGGSLEGAGKSLTEIGEPDTDFTAIAQGFGVKARVARDVPSFAAALEESFRTRGPMLIAAEFG
jgi:acetolactate synthase-1/2/3 large subunit